MNCKTDKAMEREHWEQWGKIRQYEREHPIRDMLEWIVAMLIVGLLTMVFWVFVGIAILYIVFVVLSFVSTTLVNFGVL